MEMELRSVENSLNELVLAQSEQVLLRSFFMDEIWLPVIGYESFYEVSNTGKVRNLKGDVMPCHFTPKGYVRVSFKQDRSLHYCHSLVMKAFMGDRLGRVINHIDGNPSNNNLNNLEYVSQRENVCHGKSTKQMVGTTLLKNNTNKRKPWQSRLWIGTKRVLIGYYTTQEEAHKAYLNKLNEIKEENKYAKK